MDMEENVEFPISDIYDDFDNFDLGETVEKLREENESLKKHINEQNEDMEKLVKALNDMKTTNENLKNNISSLLLTAKAELGRKDNTIADLRRDLDNIAFRRYRGNFQKYNGHNNVSQNQEFQASTCENNKENREMIPKIEKVPLIISTNEYQHSVETSNNSQANREQSLDKLHSSRYNNYQERALNINKETRETEYLDLPGPLFVEDHNSQIYVKQENKDRNKIKYLQEQGEYDNLERNHNHVDKRCSNINQDKNVERNYKLEDVDRHRRHINKNNLTNQQDNHRDSRWNNKNTRDRSRYRNDEDKDRRRDRNGYRRNSNRFDGRSMDLRYEERKREESDEQFSRRRYDYRKDGKAHGIYGTDRSRHRLPRFLEKKRSSLDRYKTQDDLDDYKKDKSRTGKKLPNDGRTVKDKRQRCYSALLGENLDILLSEEGEKYSSEEVDENNQKECKMDECNTDLKITINNRNNGANNFFAKEVGNILDGIQNEIRNKNVTTTLECNYHVEAIEKVVEPSCATKTKTDLISEILQEKTAEILSLNKIDKKKRNKSGKQAKLKVEDIFGESSVDESPEKNVQEYQKNRTSTEENCIKKQKVLLNNIFGDESNDIFKEDDDFRNFRMLVEADNVNHTKPKKSMKCAKLEIKESFEGATRKKEKKLASYDIGPKRKRSSDNDNKTIRRSKREQSEAAKSDIFLLTKKQSNELDSYDKDDEKFQEIKKKYDTKKLIDGGDEVNKNKQYKSKMFADKYYEEPPPLISDFEYTFEGELKNSKQSALEQEKSTENFSIASDKEKKVNLDKKLTIAGRRNEEDKCVIQNGSDLKNSTPLTARRDKKFNENVDTSDRTKKVSHRRKSTKSDSKDENDKPTTQNENDLKNSERSTTGTVDKSSENANTALDKMKNISQRRQSTRSNSRHGSDTKQNKRCENDLSETPNNERDLNNPKSPTSPRYAICSKNVNADLEKKNKTRKRRESTRSNRHEADTSTTPDESADGIKTNSRSPKPVKNKLYTDIGKTGVSSTEKKAIRSKMSDEINASTIINKKHFAEPPPILSDFEYTILEDLKKSQSEESPTKLSVNTKPESPTNIIVRTFENTEEHKKLFQSHSSKVDSMLYSGLLKETEVHKLPENNSVRISDTKAKYVGANAKATNNYSESHTDTVTVLKIPEAYISEESKKSSPTLDNTNSETPEKVTVVSDIMVSPSKKKINNCVSDDKPIQEVLYVQTNESVDTIVLNYDKITSKQEKRRGLTTEEICVSTECVKPKSLSRKNLLLERYASEEINNKNLTTSTTVSCVNVNENSVQTKNDNGIHNKRKQIDESVDINPPKKKKPVDSIGDKQNDETSPKNKITKSDANQEFFGTSKDVKPVKQPARRPRRSRERSSEPDQVLKDTATSEKDACTPKKSIKKEMAVKYNEENTAATKEICESKTEKLKRNENNLLLTKCREDNSNICSTNTEEAKVIRQLKALSDLDVPPTYGNQIAPDEHNINIIKSAQHKFSDGNQPESKQNISSSCSTIKNPCNSSTCSTESPTPRKRITPIPVKDVPVCTFTNILNKSGNLTKQLPKKVVMNTHMPEDTDIPILHLEEFSFSNLGEGKTLDKSIMKFLDGFSVSNLDCDVSRVSNESQKKEPLTFTNVLEKINSPCSNVADFTSPDQHLPKMTTSTPKGAELSALQSDQAEKTPTSVPKTDKVVLSPQIQEKEHQNKDVSTDVNSNKNNEAVDSENVKNVPFTNLNTPARFRRRCRIIAVRKL